MEKSLVEAAQEGDVESLLKSMESDPTHLEVIVMNGQDSPLHVAAIYGHLNFIKEILKINSNLGKELNKDGFTPLHISASMGHLEVCKELLEKLGNEICLIKGKDRRIPLHYAAMRGKLDVLDELVSANPNSLEEITSFGETCLHLAIKYYQFDGFVSLLEHLKKFNKLHILNKQDNQGNTLLHLAVLKRQYEVIEFLIGSRISENRIYKDSIEVNSLNSNGLTPLDLLLNLKTEPEDIEILKILSEAGGVRSQEQEMNATTIESQEWLDSFKDSPKEIRNVLLVIAILIATATYQAALSPPGGVWQEDYCEEGNCLELDKEMKKKAKRLYFAGTTIMGSKSWISYGIFIFLNSIGFYSSIELISLLIKGLPFNVELQICLTAIGFTYGFAMSALSPNLGLGLFLIASCVFLPIIIGKVPNLIRRYGKKTRVSPVVNT